jgi:hypothetical protein
MTQLIIAVSLVVYHLMISLYVYEIICPKALSLVAKYLEFAIEIRH